MINKGTIAYIGGFELPDKNAAAHRVMANSKIFRELGYDVVLIGTDRAIPNNTQIITTKSHYDNFVTYSYPYPISKLQWLKNITTIDAYIEVLKTIPNLKYIICYNFAAVSLERLRRYCKNKKILILGDVTEWESVESGNFFFKTVKLVDISLRMRVIHKKLDGLIVISNYLKKYYKNMKNIIVCPSLYYNKQSYNNSIDDNCVRITFAGNPGKNCCKERLDLVLSAINALTTYNFNIEIFGVNNEDIDFFYSILNNESKEKVHINPKVNHKTIVEKIVNSNFSIIPRESTRKNNAGFPTKLGESLSLGTPVISTDTSDIKQYITSGVDGFIIESCTAKSIEVVLRHIFEMPYEDLLKMKQITATNKKLHIDNFMQKFAAFFGDLDAKQ